MLHMEFNTPALRLAVIRPRTDPNQEKNMHIHHSANAERLACATNRVDGGTCIFVRRPCHRAVWQANERLTRMQLIRHRGSWWTTQDGELPGL